MNSQQTQASILNRPTRFADVSPLRRDWSPAQTAEYIRKLPVWDGPIEVIQKFGGLQNRTFFVTTTAGERFAVRVGFDQLRTRQTSVLECTLAAHALGVGPKVVYAEPNLTVTEFVKGKGLELEQMKDPAIVQRVIERMKILHEGAHALRGSISYWSPFDTVRRYLRHMAVGCEANGFKASKWSEDVPRLQGVVDELENAIRPFIPKLTHNDMVFVNIMFNERDEIVFIDWDGGGYGHPLWDVGEMLMWAEADKQLIHFALECYYGKLSNAEMKQPMQEVRAFQVLAALRVFTEVMEADMDPYFFLTPEEMSESMKLVLPGQTPALAGLAELLLPRFESLWAQYRSEFSA